MQDHYQSNNKPIPKVSGYKNSVTLLSLVFKDVEVFKGLILKKVRVKIYNKGAQAIESESVFGKIGNGLKKMFHRYNDEQSSRYVWTKANGYSRIEISFYC